MLYSQNVQSCLSEIKGLKIYLDKAKIAVEKILIEKHKLPMLDLPYYSEDIEELQKIANKLKSHFENIVVLGTGGSSLGGQALCSLKHPGFNLPQQKPNIYFIDNIDPNTFKNLFETLKPKKTGFIVISKSGSSPETLSQILIIIDRWKKEVKDITKHFVIITEDKKNPLKKIADQYKFDFIKHNEKIGGRFSAFSCVGLLPAMLANLDVKKIRLGAQQTLRETFSTFASKPSIGAVISVALLEQKNISINVMMPYLDRLKSFGMWYRQLVAESLGKNQKGITPIVAMGTVDQHSQLQLYIDGPQDKYFTFIVDKNICSLGEQMNSCDLKYLDKKKMGDLLDAEYKATEKTLVNNNRPTRVITIAQLDEQTIGALMMHFFLEVMIMADLMEVDAFDQPAVEQNKILIRKYMKEQK